MRFFAFLTAVFAGSFADAQEKPQPFASFDLASAPILNDPHDLALGPDGNLYVADKFGNRIVILDPDTLELITVLGEGALPGVHDISFGPNGRTAIAVTGASAVAVYDDVGSIGSTPNQVFSAPGTEGALAHSNGRIYAIASAIGVVAAFEGVSIVASAQGHLGAHDITEGLNGNIWIADNGARRLVKYSKNLELLMTLDHAKFGFAGPRYLDVDDFGRLIVADQDAHRILMIDPNGPDGGTLLGVLGDGSPGLGANKFDDPEGVAVSGNRYFFADSDNNRIVRYSVVLN